MKKAMLVAFFIVALPGASWAGEKTLAEIIENTITLAEKTISCTAPGSACTEDDAIVVKAEAVNGLRDSIGLARHGDLRRIKLSSEHISNLSLRVESLQSRLVHVGMFESACNLGLRQLDNALAGIQIALLWWDREPVVAGIFLVSGLLGLPVACLLLLSCAFWWL